MYNVDLSSDSIVVHKKNDLLSLGFLILSTKVLIELLSDANDYLVVMVSMTKLVMALTVFWYG